MKKAFLFLPFLFVSPLVLAKSGAPWKDGSTVECRSPSTHSKRAEFVLTVVKASIHESQFGGGVSEMKIEGKVFEEGRILHEFSEQTFTGSWPRQEGSKFEFFFSEGWPQVTYFIARFDDSFEVKDAFAIFYPTQSYQYRELQCRLILAN